jgi:hypothetical protein
MRIVMKTYSTDENFNADADYAYVEITAEMAKVIAGRFSLFDAAKRSNPDLIEMQYTSSLDEVGFYLWGAFNDTNDDGDNEFLPGEEAESHYEDNGWCEVPEDSKLNKLILKPSSPFDDEFMIDVESVYMCIGVQGVNWEGYPGHSSIRLQTEVLPREILRRVM